MKKTCTRCKNLKVVDDFYKRDSECKVCRRERSRNYNKDNNRNEWRRLDRQSNPTKYREWEVKRNYGLSAEKYYEILKSQEGRCGGCGVEFSDSQLVYIDHDHKCCPQKRGCCGKCVRGALCRSCNTALGLLKDSSETLEKLINYLNGDK